MYFPLQKGVFGTKYGDLYISPSSEGGVDKYQVWKKNVTRSKRESDQPVDSHSGTPSSICPSLITSG